MNKGVISVLALVLIAVAAQCLPADTGAQDTARPAIITPAQRPGFARTAPNQMRLGVLMALQLPPAPLFEVRADQLGLTDEQKTQIKDAMEKAEAKLQPLRDDVAQKGATLRDALFMSTAEPLALKSLLDVAEKAEAALAEAQLAAWNNLRNILSSEQLDKLRGILGAAMPQSPMPAPGAGNASPPPPPPPPPAPAP